jgi:hypothetical protein
VSNEIANLLAQRFIARTDVKAIQTSNGYMPHVEDKRRPDETRLPWRREDLISHLNCKQTFGHYIINQKDQCKLFAFDVDLEQTGWLPTLQHPIQSDPWFTDEEMDRYFETFESCNPRQAWLDRRHPGRYHMKIQFREIAHKLIQAIRDELELPCTAAYSGSKGIHIYAFTGLISAHEAREGARIVLDSIGGLETFRGENFYRFKDQEPTAGYPNLTIEVFPKQDSLSGKDLGNLMRIPLGRNLKNPKDPTFFMSLWCEMSEMRPVDPIWALTKGATAPWLKPGE